MEPPLHSRQVTRHSEHNLAPQRKTYRDGQRPPPENGLRKGRECPWTNLHSQNQRNSLAVRAWVLARQSSHWSLSFSPPLWYRRLRQGLARACLVTPFHDCASLLVGVPSIILLNPASPTSFRPAQAPLSTVSRVRDFGASGRARTQASHSNGPISVRVALYVLFLSASPFSTAPFSRIPSRIPSRTLTRPDWPARRATPLQLLPAVCRKGASPSNAEGRAR